MIQYIGVGKAETAVNRERKNWSSKDSLNSPLALMREDIES